MLRNILRQQWGSIYYL